jgi:hypothetical protein
VSGLNVLIHQNTRDRDYRGKAARIVGDAGRENSCAIVLHLDRRFSRENRIEVRGDDHGLRLGSTRLLCDDISDFVDRNVQCQIPKQGRDEFAALPFAIGWRRDLNDREHVLDRFLIEGPYSLARSADPFVASRFHALTTLSAAGHFAKAIPQRIM